MSAGVELVERILEADPEQGLDLDRLASHKETMETLERLNVASPSGGSEALRGELADHSIHIFPSYLPHRSGELGEETLEHSGPVLDGDWAEAPGDLRGDVRVDQLGLIVMRIRSRALGSDGLRPELA